MNRSRIPARKPPRGFTLIEIAVVVAIMLTLLTLGLGLMNAQLSSTAYSVTKKRQEAIKDALIAYLGANRRLPCPYVPTPGIVVTGQAPNPSGTPPACPAFGVVPYATLGLGREIGEDGWGNLFFYWVYFDPSPSCPGTGWDWGHSNCFGEGKDGINPPKVALKINDGTVASPTLLTDKSIAVVISHGANGLGAWAAQGTRNAPPTTCEETHNAVGTAPPPGCTPAANTYYKGERSENDDVVAYLTANDALQLLARQGAIKSATAKVNEDLQLLFEQAVGNYLTSPTCSLPPPSSGLLDPWGNLYVYVLAPPAGSVLGTYSSTNLPSISKAIDKTVLDVYRNRAGSPPCP